MSAHILNRCGLMSPFCPCYQSGIPVAEQSLSYNERELSNPKSTIKELGVEGPSAVLVLRRKVAMAQGGWVLDLSI